MVSFCLAVCFQALIQLKLDDDASMYARHPLPVPPSGTCAHTNGTEPRKQYNCRFAPHPPYTSPTAVAITIHPLHCATLHDYVDFIVDYVCRPLLRT